MDIIIVAKSRQDLLKHFANDLTGIFLSKAGARECP